MRGAGDHSSQLESSLQTRVRFQAVLQPAATGRHMRQCTIGPASPGLGEGLVGRDDLVPLCSSDSCGGPGACTLTRSPVVQCFLRHIGAAGFQVKRAVWLGKVMFRRTHGSRPSPLQSPYGSCRVGTRLQLPIGNHEKGGKPFF